MELILPANDYGFTLTFVVTDAAGAAMSLLGYTIKFKMWRAGLPGTLLVNGTCTILVAADGTCTYVIAAADTATPGTYVGELELTKSGVIESTATFPVRVLESG